MFNIQRNIPLAPFTTFHIGGPADYFVVVHSKEEILEAATWAREKNLPFFILGSGANILIGDKGYRGVVVKNEARKYQISNIQYPISNETFQHLQGESNPVKNTDTSEVGSDSILLTAESGAVVADIIQETAELGLSGFEHFAGIPSTIGGALWQNLHFLSPDRKWTIYISEILESAEILQVSSLRAIVGNEAISSSVISKNEVKDLIFKNNKIMNVDPSYFHFSYDYSSLHDTHDLVLSATFRLIKKDPQEIKKVINANLQWRQQKHPKNAENCSAGSVFKKIESYGAGRLIEKVGLKGKQIGGAQISSTHANFIINTGKATAKDVRDLIELVQITVKRKLGLDMQPEISFVGEF